MKKILCITTLAVLLTPFLNAQVDRSKRPAPGPTPNVVVGSYQKQVLPNGLTVLVVEDHKIPKVSYNLFVDYDPIMQGAQEGYVEFAGGLLGTGSETKSKDQFNDELDFIGANANFSSTGFFASALKKHNEKLLELVSDALIHPKFTQEELDKIRKKALSALAAAKTEPDAIAQRVASQLVYGKDHPYGQNQDENSVNAITLDQCRQFYQNYFRPNVSYLAIVGDITMTEALPLVTKYLGSWERKEVPKQQYSTPVPPAKNTIALVDRPNAVQSVIRVTYPLPFRIGEPDYIKGRIMNIILGGGTFRLFNNLREKHGYTYGAYSQLNPDKYISEFEATAEVRNSVTDSALVQILYEMNRMRSEAVPAEELEMVKNYASGTFSLSLEKPETVANFALNIEKYQLPSDNYNNYLKNLASVSVADIQQAARNYLKPENAYFVVVGKAEEITKPLAALTPGNNIRYFDVDGKEYDPTQKIKAAPADMTAEKVIEKYLEAVGGRKALTKMKDITVSMTTSIQGMTLSFKNYRKAPNRMMVEISAGGMVMSKQVFDGTKGYVNSPMGNEELSGEMLDALRNEAIFNPELDYAGNGFKLQLVGIEDIGGKEAYKVEIIPSSGDKSTSYFDVNTGLKVREMTSEGSTDFSDYREVKGVKLPFQMDAEMQGQALQLKVETVEINKKLKDTLFKI